METGERPEKEIHDEQYLSRISLRGGGGEGRGRGGVREEGDGVGEIKRLKHETYSFRMNDQSLLSNTKKETDPR